MGGEAPMLAEWGLLAVQRLPGGLVTAGGWFTPLNHVTLFVAQLTCVSGARRRRSLHYHHLQVQQPWPLLQDFDPRGSS